MDEVDGPQDDASVVPGNEPDVDVGATGDDVETEDAAMEARREMLKKAAAGFAVAGGVWVAPRIEGLSLAPDYAAAGTARGTFRFSRTASDAGSGGYYTDDCWGTWSSGCNPAVQNATIGNGGVAEPIKITWSGRADIGGNGSAVVDFSQMDPPFNSNCAVTGLTGGVNCCLGSHRTNAINPTQAFWDTQPNGVQTAQGQDVTITIVC